MRKIRKEISTNQAHSLFFLFSLVKKNMPTLHLPPQLLLFHHSSFSENLKYFKIIMHMTENKNITHANRSFAKQRPNTK